MEQKNYQKLVEYLYKSGINNTGRRKTRPTDNEDILKPLDIDTINLGKDRLKRLLFVRVLFVGSNKWYELHINSEKYDWWADTIRDIHFIDEFQDSKKGELPW